MNWRTYILTLSIGVCTVCSRALEPDFDARGRQFIGIDSLAGFTNGTESSSAETVLTSPKLQSRIHFNEVVLSWNADTPGKTHIIVEARVIYPEMATKYYELGLWSASSKEFPRRSVPDQKDTDGDVRTDTLVLQQPADCLQIRLRLAGEEPGRPTVRFLGISLADTNVRVRQLPPETNAWDKLLPVPQRTQMIYPNGKTLCSPTTVSMLMAFWAETLKRPELDHTVPEVAAATYDAQWQGAGNWPFNMAYAGSFKSMRAYVARFSDVSELEQWIAEGTPVGLSVDYDRLRAKGPGPNGHLVVCVGFTKAGDPVINDPGTSHHVQKIFPRRNLIDAWACSRNTVYLVYPENAATPSDRFGHWDSATSRAWI